MNVLFIPGYILIGILITLIIDRKASTLTMSVEESMFLACAWPVILLSLIINFLININNTTEKL